MPLLSHLAVSVLAAEHVYIMVLEMFLWTTPRGMKAFGMKKEFAEKTKTLAANQGLYNGFLAAGLFWGLIHPVPEVSRQLSLFFSSCVLVAGIYGGATANKKILFVQGVPALAAVAAVLFS
ncbi:hypothetical protein ONS95_011928 [Cadophora gregata]|uniref:uncharacterized protein n=1 Tax=Cadophora gregata TaxID=51156 RepID=UPI0026DD02B6|nr:uncharacterized protein ONS95_011928 [Cadophora gregata]KAK0117592.1 hypothetical protein ONS95_011928 [Cadophora gregata]KAK0122643.1 hypothetical protein ONS96_009682 [Cadophora gregata f. sp. sojae]